VAISRDILVVGAGIVGCAVAHELASRGASVAMVDMRTAGMGATQASAGVLAPYIEAREDGTFLDLTVRSLDLFDEFIARVSADSGLPIQYQRTGTLDVATDEGGMRAMRASADLLDGRGIAADLLDAAATRSAEPLLTTDVAGGLVIPAHGFVSAPGLTHALAAAARRLGVQITEHGRVRRISPQDGGMLVETDQGTLTAGAVVLAAGSWSGSIQIAGVHQHVPVRPVRGQLLHLAWQGQPVRRVTWSARCYLVPWDDGTLLVGATAEEAGFDERTTAAGVRDLLDAVCDLVPHAWAAGFLGARVGLRPASIDELPIIGPSTAIPNLMYATGHFRNGILLAPLTAKLVADAMLDRRLDGLPAEVQPSRFGEL
jgi:glycine oxidase